MYDAKSFATYLSALRVPYVQQYTHQIVIVLVDGLEKRLVNVALAESVRLDSLEHLGELDSQLHSDGVSRRADLWRSLGKRSGLVRVIPSDLIDLVRKVTEQEALDDQLHPSLSNTGLTFSSPASSAISVGISKLSKLRQGVTYQHWPRRRFQGEEHLQERVSCYSATIS
jgi:hypothetical protein